MAPPVPSFHSQIVPLSSWFAQQEERQMEFTNISVHGMEKRKKPPGSSLPEETL